MLTRQKLFDNAWAGLKAQGFVRSLREVDDGLCLYRGPNGRKCAIGFSIPDEVYNPDIEDNVDFIKIVKLLNVSFHDFDFVWKLRAAHDVGKTPEKMEENLRDLAIRHNLSIQETTK